METFHPTSDKLSYAERKLLPDSEFGLPETREYPLTDAAHVRAAEAYFRFAPEDKKPFLARRILEKAKEFGVNIKSEILLSKAQE